MTSRLRVAGCQLLHARGRSLVLVLCIAVSFAIPVLTTVVVRHYQEQLEARAKTTPLLAGSKGNRIDLTLSSLYFRDARYDSIPFARYEEMRDWHLGIAVPLNLRFQARGRPIVATSQEYFELRGLRLASGSLPRRMGQVCLGAEAAESLELGPGDFLFSDQEDLYDITKPAALKMHVVGVLAPSEGPDDRAVFVDIKSAWILEGIAHGHEDAEEIPEDKVLAETDGHRTFSGALIEYNEVRPDNEASYHYHGDTEGLPLSSILYFPNDKKSGTIARARMNSTKLWQMIHPQEVVRELMDKIFQMKAVLDGVSILVALSTAFLVGLVLVLSARMRKRELVTLHHIGFQSATIVQLLGLEVLALLTAGLVVGTGLVSLAWALMPDLVTAL